MTVLTIRTHKRYAVRQRVQVAKPGRAPVDGLMIELSSEGLRISNLGRSGFVAGEAVRVEIEDRELAGHIRWAREGLAGVRLEQPLFNSELNDLITRGRCDSQGPVPRYGTSG